jgi:hypothetical protein
VAQAKLAKNRAISNIEVWTDAFISYSHILLERHPQKANELYAYMAIIRSAASECAIEKWYAYDQKLQLRVARDHTKNWVLIDGQLWLQLIALGIQKKQPPSINKCFEFNVKGKCHRNNCFYKHICIKCSMNHPTMHCKRYLGIDTRPVNQRFFNRPIRPMLPKPATITQTFNIRIRYICDLNLVIFQKIVLISMMSGVWDIHQYKMAYWKICCIIILTNVMQSSY